MSLSNGLGSVGVPNGGGGPSANGGFGPANPPPPPLSLGSGPPQQGPSVLQILAMGQERNHAADSIAHHPRMESLIKLGKESEQTWIQIGHTAEALGDLERAIASYESALRHNAYSVVALSQIAAICRSKEEFKKAAEYFGRVVGIAPESGDVWGALGHCFLMIDDLKKAYSSYQQALYYMPNPQEPKLWYGIGILYDRYGSLEHAEEAFSSVIRMDPNFEKANEIFFRLGIIYKQQRRSAQSLECFQYILKNPPRPLTEIDIWFQIGHVHEQQKDYIAAKESYERVLAENPQHAKVLQQLGGLYHRSQAPFYNPDLSVTILTKSLESDPNDPFSWYLLGRAYMTSSNFGKAYEAYQQAVYRDGKNPAFWCSIGVLYYNINQFHDALDAYSRAIRIHPYLAEVWFNLGALYESCNDQMTDAIDAYQRTLQLDPSNTIVSQRLREIRDHQSTGQPLSTPPQPKDISPSSLSWNFATNSGAAPGQLTQGGSIGAELSPAMSRSGGAGSPANGHRFDGPPPAAVRPHSTDPYRAGPGPIDARRGSNSAHGPPGGIHHSPATSIDHSPRIGNRHPGGPGAAHLPGIRHTQEVRGSPTIPDPRRGSPVSPRTRGPLGAGMGGEHPKAAGYEDDWRRRGPPGPPIGSAFNSPRPNGGPPGFEDARYQAGPLYAGQPSAYGPGDANPTLRRFGGEREIAPPQHQMDDQPRRRSSASTTGGRQDGSPRLTHSIQPEPQHAQLPPIPTQPPHAPSPVLVKAKAGRVKKEDESSPRAVPASRGRKSDASVASGGAPASNGSGVAPRKEKKAPGPAKGRKSGSTNGQVHHGHVAGHSPTESSSVPVSPIPVPVPVPVPAPNAAPNREVDEEYDEGVDALMGLAASAGSVSPQQPAVAPIVAAAAALAAEPTVEAVSVPVPVQVEQPVAVPAPVSPEGDNPRKRTLGSPEVDEAAKRAKPSEEVDELAGESPPGEAEEAPGAGEVVAAAVPVQVEATPVPVQEVVAQEVEEKEAEPERTEEPVAVEVERMASPVAVPAPESAEVAAPVAVAVEVAADGQDASPVVEQSAEAVTEPAQVQVQAQAAVDEADGEKAMEIEEGEVAA